jgi:hypothetical protein
MAAITKVAVWGALLLLVVAVTVNDDVHRALGTEELLASTPAKPAAHAKAAAHAKPAQVPTLRG